MGGLLRSSFCFALALFLSWWVALRVPPGAREMRSDPPHERPLSVGLTPVLTSPVELASAPLEAPVVVAGDPPEQAPPEPEPEPETAEESAPPPPESGAPDGEEDAGPAPESVEEVDLEDTESAETEPVRTTSEELMADVELVATARAEFSGDVPRGFVTVLLAAPEDQFDIARFFGEELVLVPRAALDPDGKNPGYFRLAPQGPPAVEAVAGRPPLERYRQYRDLFDYEYTRLPSTLRELRRSVLSRGEIYLFAALIPAREWAVVVGRRREALQRSGREGADVDRYVLRYLRRALGGFDVRVEEIVFSDGTRFRPEIDAQGV